MSVIHFVGGEKGGVGKSVLSRAISQYFLDNSLVYAGFDADQSHATLSRYYPEFTQAINLDVFNSIDKIMEAALEADKQILIDLPAQSQRFLDRWIEEAGVLEMCEEMNIPLVFWYVVDDGQDSVQLLDGFLGKYGTHLQTAVVKNQGRGSDFSDIKAMIQENHADIALKHLTIPALHADTMRQIDKLHFSFWAATHVDNEEQNHLSLMERQRAKVWSRKVYAEIEEVVLERL